MFRPVCFATYICILMALFRVSDSHAQADLGPAIAVENIVGDIKKGLEELINQAESAYSRQAFDTRMHALVVLQNLDTVTSGLIDKSFGQLDASQKKFFTDANAILAKWNAGNKDLARDLDNLTRTIEEAASRLPLADKTPLVKSYRPSYVAAAPNTDSFAVKVSGVRIGAGSPTLKFGKNECDLFAKTDRDIEFRCKRSIFGKLTVPRDQSGVLEVIAPKSFMDWITFTENRVAYRIGVIGIPAKMGDYTVRAVVPTSTVETQDRSQYFEHTNSHCSGSTSLNWPVNASDGWKIVEKSVRTTPTSVSSGCSGPSAESISSSGFRVTGRAVNTGNCVKVLGQTISKDGRGWVKGFAYWTEHRTVIKNGDVDVGKGVLAWGSDKSVALPAGALSFVMTIVRVDGTEKVITSAGVYDRYEVGYDEASRTVVVKPKDLDAALAT